ncbi:MAG: mechanosensitive ion channel family protein [Bacteroidaceae bacterium]|nr:mechanosensitive ion channel family protein [Bacteroidaceae bacterium]
MNFNFAVLLAVVLVVSLFCCFVVNPIAKKIAEKTPNKFDDLLVEKNFISRFLQIVPAVIFGIGSEQLLKADSWHLDVCTRISNVWFALVGFAVGCAFFDVVEALNDKSKKNKNRPLHGIFQAIKLVIFCCCSIVIVSQISGKSPVFILSALGAAATVLMLVFRDSILGVVSGIQINISDLLRKGDWIEIPRHDANGTVIDITLTSVKVRNWDHTIAVIPAYELITNSFKNWRGMEESGGRRIKRSIFLDQHSIRFLTEEEIERLSRINILGPYMEKMKKELAEERESQGDFGKNEMTLVNNRHMTNIGTFRAYCNVYLRSCGKIAQNMTLMTRQLAPTPQGLPLEIYAFTNVIQWVAYETIQSDIFDHLIAVLPEFGLSVFQYAGYPKAD